MQPRRAQANVCTRAKVTLHLKVASCAIRRLKIKQTRNLLLQPRHTGPCPWRIRKSCRDRHLEQAAAVMLPSVVVKDGMGGRPLARSFSRSTAIERLVNAMFVVIISDLFQLSLQVDCVPD